MGGNVFPGKTRRYDRAEYFGLLNSVLERVATFATAYTEIPAYNNKPSFGDMDVLFSAPTVGDLQTLFDCGADEVVHNGGVWSLVFQQFQIDLIKTPLDEMAYALHYFSYNDRGNLVGRLAHKLGLKHGHDGLWFPVRSNDHVLGEILLTLDPLEAESFLDVAHPPADGFDALEDIFQNVAASKYFNPEIFLLENRNHTSRVRDRKRATYTAFLDWCKTMPPQEFYQFDRDKSVYHKKIFKAFPHAKKQFDELWRRKHLIEEAAAMFNGDLVKQWTGREGAALGELMRVLKVALTPEFVVTQTNDEIHEYVMAHHALMLVKMVDG